MRVSISLCFNQNFQIKSYKNIYIYTKFDAKQFLLRTYGVSWQTIKVRSLPASKTNQGKLLAGSLHSSFFHHKFLGSDQGLDFLSNNQIIMISLASSFILLYEKKGTQSQKIIISNKTRSHSLLKNSNQNLVLISTINLIVNPSKIMRF